MRSSVSLWKISLFVWAPVIIIGALYGLVYFIQYKKASTLQTRYNNYLTACSAEYSSNQALLQEEYTKVRVDAGYANLQLGQPIIQTVSDQQLAADQQTYDNDKKRLDKGPCWTPEVSIRKGVLLFPIFTVNGTPDARGELIPSKAY